MTDSRFVLLLGSSTVSFSESDSELSMPALLARELSSSHPGTNWRCEAATLYITPSMAQRATAMTERQQPDVVLLRPSSTAFLSDLVVYRIRDRWPRAYRTAVKWSSRMRDLAGVSRDTGSGLRSWLFLAPRAVLKRIVGVAPSLSPEQAASYVIETLDSLTRLEDAHVLLYLSSQSVSRGLPKPEHERRVAIYRAAIAAHCRARRIPLFDVELEMGERAPGWTYDADRWHPTLAFREADARVMASRVLAILADAPVG